MKITEIFMSEEGDDSVQEFSELHKFCARPFELSKEKSPAANKFGEFLKKENHRYDQLTALCSAFFIEEYGSTITYNYVNLPEELILELCKDFLLLEYSPSSYGPNGIFISKEFDACITIRLDDKINKLYSLKLKSCRIERLEKYGKTLLNAPKLQNKTIFKVLMQEQGGLFFKEAPITAPKVDIALNYGDAFVAHHEKVVEMLKTRETGIFIFSGDPGTGKTTYIKYLASLIGRGFLFIPEMFSGSITSPDFVGTMSNETGSILVIEDAENAIRSREEGSGSPVSTLLNIGDGIMGSVFNMPMILSFNTGKDQIEKALLRKGRLAYEIEFNKLTEFEAKRLAEHLGKNPDDISGPTALCDVYGLGESTNFKKKVAPRIGF